MSRQLKLDGEKLKNWLYNVPALENRTQTWLAGELEVSRETVGNMLAGDVPNARTLRTLAHLMGVKMEDLLVGPEKDRQSA